jgi:hypothetical protein
MLRDRFITDGGMPAHDFRKANTGSTLMMVRFAND